MDTLLTSLQLGLLAVPLTALVIFLIIICFWKHDAEPGDEQRVELLPQHSSSDNTKLSESPTVSRDSMTQRADLEPVNDDELVTRIAQIDRSPTMHPALIRPLTIEDFKEVQDKVWNARLSWYYLGIQLKLNVASLDVIQQNLPNDTDKCFQKMIALWLRSGTATWNQMVSALAHTSVQHAGLAESIRQYLIGLDVITADTSFTHVPETPGPPHNYSDQQRAKDIDFEFLNTEGVKETDDVDDLKARLRRETNKIRKQFGHILVDIQEHLKDKKYDVNQISTAVWTLCYGCDSSERVCSLLDSDQCDDIDGLFRRLQEDNCISFIDHDIVDFLIERYGSNAMKTKLQRYRTDFAEYCKRSVFEVPRSSYSAVETSGHRKLLVCKIIKSNQANAATERETDHDNVHDSAWESAKQLNISVSDAKCIQEKIADTLNLSPAALILVDATRGCIELTFSVPKTTMDKLATENCYDLGIDKLDAQGIHFLCDAPGQPSRIVIGHGNVALRWNKPKFEGLHQVQQYKIHYRSVYDPPNRWKLLNARVSARKNNIDLSQFASQLGQHSTCIFKIEAVSDIGSVFSKESEPIRIPRSSDDCSAIQHEITIPDLMGVVGKVRGAADKWYEIGIQLGLSKQILDEIKQNSSEASQCLNSMLTKWIEQGEATMENLRTALEAESVGRYKQSDRLSFRLSNSKNRDSWYI